MKKNNINNNEIKLTPNNLIKVIDLKKKYKRKEILNIKSLTINKNNRIAIFAPPKAGKTVLCEILVGWKKYNSGVVLRQNNIYINLQTDSKYYSQFTSCYDYIKLFLDNYHIDLKSEDFHLYLKELDLLNIIDKPLSVLTYEQKQRANILISIIANPDLIILDEITNNLDINSKNLIFDFLTKFYNKNNSSYIIVTNDFKDIEKMSDTLWILYNGRIIENISTIVAINGHGSIKKYIDNQFNEYYYIKEKYKNIDNNFIRKEIMNESWSKKWNNENSKRKARINKF